MRRWLAVACVACGARTELATTSAAEEATVFASDDTTLYKVHFPSGTRETIGLTLYPLDDLALSAQGNLVELSFDGLSEISTISAATSLNVSLGGAPLDGADRASDGTLFVCGVSSVFTVDETQGVLHLVATLPSPFFAEGDLAFVGQRLLVTASTHVGSDVLFELDRESGVWTSLGPIGFSCVYGLATSSSKLYGFTCEGRIVAIDVNDGAGTELAHYDATFRGAAGR